MDFSLSSEDEDEDLASFVFFGRPAKKKRSNEVTAPVTIKQIRNTTKPPPIEKKNSGST